jgi:hypothetical protein
VRLRAARCVLREALRAAPKALARLRLSRCPMELNAYLSAGQLPIATGVG